MSTGSTAILPAATLDEDAREDLLSFIEERQVIPIVGPELLQVSTDRGPRLPLDWAAEKLAARLNVSRTDLPEHYTLNDREWSHALERARNMADGARFILPVSLDETSAAEAHVPERFKALHFTQLPGGRVTPEFTQRLAEFVRRRSP